LRLMRSLNCVADILAISQRSLTQQRAIAPVHRKAVTRIWPRLLAADVLLHRAIDYLASLDGCSSFLRSRSRNSTLLLRSPVRPRRFEVLIHSLATTFTSIAALAISAKATRSIKQIRAVHPHHARFDLRGNIERHVDALTPNAGS